MKKSDDMDKISIVVPVYNVEKFLSRCIDSIICQTYKNLEIILVDDGSKDNSSSICDLYEKKDKRIKVIHKENGGLSSARNAGIEEATGDYIAFVDSDDYIEPNMYEEMYNAAKKLSCDIITCNYKYVYDDGSIKLINNDKKNEEFDFVSSIKEMNLFNKFDMSACTKLFKKDLFDDIRFPVGKLSEDYYIMYLLFEKSNKVYYIASPYYNYFQRKNSITKSNKINHDFMYAALEQMKYLETKYPDELKNICHAAFLSANLTVYDFYLKNGVKCPKEMLKVFKNNVKGNYKYVKKAKMYGIKKKIQFVLFMYCVPLYNVIFKMYKKI